MWVILRLRSPSYGPDEWLFFLQDVAAHQLTPDGRVLLKLNREADGSYGSRALLQFFRENRAAVKGERVYFASMSPFRAPGRARR